MKNLTQPPQENKEVTNKYNSKNPYYTAETESAIEDHKEVVNNRLDEIDKKDIQYIEKQANHWGKTIIDKDLLEKLKNFDFWKDWKNNGI